MSTCLARSRGWGILTNEKSAKNWAHDAGIEYWDLPGILRSLWRADLLTKEEVRELIAQIEAKDRVVLGNIEAIFQEL